MKIKRIIGVLIGAVLFFLPCEETALAGPFEKGPVREPKKESPFVIKNIQGKPVFEEYFEERAPRYEKYYLGNEITGFKLLDPSTGEVMLDVAMQDGVLSREIEGTAKDNGKKEKSQFSSIVHETFFSKDETISIQIATIADEVVGYRLFGKNTSRITRNIGLEKGRIRSWNQDVFLADKDGPWKVLRLNNEGEYKETIFPVEGGYQQRRYKRGLLEYEIIQNKEQNKSLYAWYHQGKLGFWNKNIYRNGNAERIEFYDENDRLVDTVKVVFGESFEIKFEETDGKAVKIFRKKRGNKVKKEVVIKID